MALLKSTSASFLIEERAVTEHAAATAQVSTVCPEGGVLTLEDWFHNGDLVELSCLNPGGEYDVAIHGFPLLKEIRGEGEEAKEPSGRYELGGFKTQVIEFKDKDAGEDVARFRRSQLDPMDARDWDAEAYALILCDSLLETIEGKRIGHCV